MENTTLSKCILTTLGAALVGAAPTLPPPWGLIAATLGGLLGGGALVRRPGDIKVVDVAKVPVPK